MDTYPGTFAFVQIHHGDDYATPWGNDRFTFYGTGGYPTSYFDGVIERVGAWPYTTYQNDYLARRALPADVTIDLTGDFVVERTYQVQANVCIETGGTGKTMRVQMVQVLDRWPASPSYSRNGFKQAVEATDITVAPGTCQAVTRCFTLDHDSWSTKDKVKIIAWAQEPWSAGPANVHQAAIMTWPFPASGLPACCMPDASCVGASYDDCVAAGGDPLGPGSACCDVECRPLKWSQPPTFNPASPEPDCYWGWDEPSAYDCAAPGCQIVADDYLCDDQRPITDMHWWGSYLGWASQDPPLLSDPAAPDSFHIGLWTDVPAGVDAPYSHPGELIREWTVLRVDLDERNVGCDFHPDFPGPDTCFRYDFFIPRQDWHLQESADPTIYWISIAAHYATGEPTIPWGWKTREHFFNDAAVAITDPNHPTAGSTYTAGHPIEHPEGVRWDMAFTLGALCPDVDAPLPERPGQNPEHVQKNRYISLVPGNPGQETALRVTLADMPAPFESYEGCQLWVGAPFDVSELAGKNDATPPTYKAANLQTEPYCTDWSAFPVLHVFDDEIVPKGTYEVQAIDCVCDFSLDASYSTALSLGSSKWGDVVGQCYAPTSPLCVTLPSGYKDCCTAPQGVVDFVDISALVDKFKNSTGAPSKARGDLTSDALDKLVDFVDIAGEVDAFRGLPYPFDGPDECP
jgi:hypothetical protein